VALAILTVMSALQAAASVPTPTIVQPTDRFFQEGNALEVVVTYDRSDTGSSPRRANASVQLVVDGVVLEERALGATEVVSRFAIPVTADDAIILIQVCVQQAGLGAEDRDCARARAAGTTEFDRLRRSLEEMNEISDAVMRYSLTRLGYRGVPQTLDELVPDFLATVPSASPFSSPYEYTATGEHFALRLALPGVGEIVSEDGSFTRLPRGAITDREAARLIRQQLTELAQSVESYRVDNNHFPAHIEEVSPVYQRFLPLVDPYGHPYVFSLAPDAYVLSSLGHDGLPGGEDFDADSKVTNGMRLVATTSYRGRYEYLRRTTKDMSQIAAALSYFREETGVWPASLSELVGGPWFFWPRPFTDDCGNPYEYHVYDVGFGRSVYQLRAHACNGVTYTDPWEDLLYYSADNEGYSTNPGWRFAYRWPGLFD
jgi:Bacterial type II secretion system protein G.